MTLTKEPFASLANQLELASPGGKLLLPIQSRRDSEDVSPAASPLKTKITKLQDTTIVKLVEGAMEEMIQVDTQQFELGAQMPTYRDYLYKYLLTKYGLPGLANSYIEQISTRSWRIETTQKVHQRRFSRPRRTHQRDIFVFINVERDILQGIHDGATHDVRFLQIFDRENWIHRIRV